MMPRVLLLWKRRDDVPLGGPGVGRVMPILASLASTCTFLTCRAEAFRYTKCHHSSLAACSKDSVQPRL